MSAVKVKTIFDEVMIGSLARYERKVVETDSVELMSEREEDRFTEYLPEVIELDHMIGEIVKGSNQHSRVKQSSRSAVLSNRPVPIDRGLVEELKKAGEGFDISHNITKILQNQSTSISCLKRDSLGLRSSHKVIEICKEDFEKALEQLERSRR